MPIALFFLVAAIYLENQALLTLPFFVNLPFITSTMFFRAFVTSRPTLGAKIVPNHPA
jgi:hypothetical protein